MGTRRRSGAAFGVIVTSAVALSVTAWAPPSHAGPGVVLTTTSSGAALPGTGATTMRLPDGSTALVDTRAGVARVTAADGTVTYRRVPATGQTGNVSPAVVVPDKAQLAALLARPAREPYAHDHIVAVFEAGAAPRHDGFIANQAALAGYAKGGPAPAYTPDPTTNRALADAGVLAETRLFGNVSRPRLRQLGSEPAPRDGGSELQLANAYLLTIAGGDPVAAAQAVLALPGIQLAQLDWAVEASGTSTALSPSASAAALRTAASLDRADRRLQGRSAAGSEPWRLNYGIASSAQSFWNSPGLDAAAAYDEIDRAFQELPGSGEIITDVGIGDLTDDNPASRCFGSGFGATTVVQGGQRYIDLPSMPLVPTYTASARSRLNPLGEVCGPDPLLRSIGHELSVMAPLPQDEQRPGNPGDGLTDLLGIAPGAKYRVVVPASDEPVVSDVTAA